MEALLRQHGPRPRILWEGFHSRILDFKIKSFRPKANFCLNYKGYTVRTVDTPAELKKVLQLRQRIFSETYDIRLSFFDFDHLDLLGDHILVSEQESGAVLGTYRVISSNFSHRFYAQGEFYVDEFLAQPGSKLELGRGCIAEKLRSGRGIDLVWKGLARYAQITGAQYMFGCTSVKTTRCVEAMSVLQACGEASLSDGFNIHPVPGYRYPRYASLVLLDGHRAKELMPTLFKSYLRAGAKVYGKPALDSKFQCSDFLTILDLDHLTASYKKRYFGKNECSSSGC